jgi:peroxiredoxin
MNLNTSSLSVAVFFLILAFSCSQEKNATQAAGATAINEQPTMVITLTDGSGVNLRELKGKKVLIFFQPDCDHCQREAQGIQKNLAGFAKTTLYFITSAPMDEIQKFADDYKLSNTPNVHFAFTPARNVLDNYGPISAPSIYIYSEEQRLVKSFNGEVEVEKILKFI